MRAVQALVLILLVSACIGGPSCESPQVIVGERCCNDGNGNGICDSAETTVTSSSTSTTTVTTSSTVTTTTTSTTSTSTTSTTLRDPAIACYEDADCGQPRNGSIYCDGLEIEGTIVEPTCLFPGRQRASCVEKVSQAKFGECEEFCQDGICYPGHCGNQWLDKGEQEEDCGGVCPPCAIKPDRKKCTLDGECGTNAYLEGYRCYNGDLIREKVNYFCRNGFCENESERIVIFDCREGMTCIDGHRQCDKNGASCYDCIKNGNEEGVDCGGSCNLTCAPVTRDPGYFKDMDLYNMRRIDNYRGYEFRYLGPLQTDNEHGICVFGVQVMVKRPNGNYTEVNATRYGNYRIDRLYVGMREADDSSAKITVWRGEKK